MINVGDNVIISKKMIISSYDKDRHIVCISPKTGSYNESNENIYVDAELMLGIKRNFHYKPIRESLPNKRTGAGMLYHLSLGGKPYYVKEAANYKESGVVLYYRAEDYHYDPQNAECVDIEVLDPLYTTPALLSKGVEGSYMHKDVTSMLSGTIIAFIVITDGVKPIVIKATTQLPNDEFAKILSNKNSSVLAYVATGKFVYRCSTYLIRKVIK